MFPLAINKYKCVLIKIFIHSTYNRVWLVNPSFKTNEGIGTNYSEFHWSEKRMILICGSQFRS